MCYIAPLNFCYNEYKLKENGSRIMATSTFRNKNKVRPIKQGAAKRQRIKAQKKRLVALGVDAATVEGMQSDQLRLLLKRPKVTAMAAAKMAEEEK